MTSKQQAVQEELSNQRDTVMHQFGNLIAKLKGELAERDALWGDLDAVKARVIELEQIPKERV